MLCMKAGNPKKVNELPFQVGECRLLKAFLIQKLPCLFFPHQWLPLAEPFSPFKGFFGKTVKTSLY